MIMSFNPITIKSIIKKMFFDTSRDDTKILKTTYNDNRFLEKEDKEDIERLKDIDNYYWSVYGLGEWGVLGNTVYTNWEVKPLDEMRKHFVSFYNGLDFGYNKPSAVLHTAYHNDDIYILDEIYENKLTLEQLAQKTIELIGREYVVCDSAEPRSIEFMKGKGIKALSARKGKDSVLNGIMWLKGKRIFVNESCINTINELSLYKWREDKDGVALDQPVDENNHALDALRYAYEDMMKDKGKGLPDNEAGVYEIEREIVY
jgi:phage terminase large subunit